MRGRGSCGVWASHKTEHPEEGQRSQTRLDLGKPDFQKKANSNLGQEGVLQITQEPGVLGVWTDSVLRPSEDYLSSHIAPLFPPGSEGEPSLPRKELRSRLSLARAVFWGGRALTLSSLSNSYFGFKHCSPQLSSHKSL